MSQDLAPAGSQDPLRQAVRAAALVIVVGLDGSPSSWDAFCWAAGMAARASGSIIAVYVTPAVEPANPVGGYFDYAAVVQARQEVAAQLKDEAAQRAAELGISFDFVQEMGDTAHALISVARTAEADLVVVGRSAKVLHHFAGSAGRRLVSRRDAPVVVVVP